MAAQVLKPSRRPHPVTVSLVSVLLLLIVPLSALAQDDQSIATLRQMGKAFASIAEKASPAVVGVQATKVVKGGPSFRGQQYGEPSNPFEEELYKYFFGPRRSPRGREEAQPRQVAQGSGFIISSDGYILTNNHLVGEAEDVSVQLSDGRKAKAKIIGADPETDVAVVKIDEDNLPYVKLADSGKLEVGEWVIAIGNPFGLSHTVTAGIVSAIGRSRIGVADYEDFIQTDAAINFGNSGGPLLNLDGQAVGINTAIIGPGGNVGIGLAIPMNMAKDIYMQLKENGKVVRGFLGVGIQDLQSGMGDFYGLDDDKGVLIASVSKDSAAEKAGIKTDDVVVELEGQPVTNMNDFRNRIAMHRPGSSVEMAVVRNGKRKTLTAVLDALPQGGAVAAGTRSDVQERLGLSVQNLTEDLARRLGFEDVSGVVVTEVQENSRAAEAGIRAGALIMEVNRESISNVREFDKAIEKAQEDGKVLMRVRDENWTRVILLPLSEK